MAPETNTDEIRRIEETCATQVDRVDNLRRGLEKVEGFSAELDKRFQDVDKRLTVLQRDVERIEARIDELLTRCWELWKLILAAFLGGLLTVATGFVSRSLDRWIGFPPNQAQPAAENNR